MPQVTERHRPVEAAERYILPKQSLPVARTAFSAGSPANVTCPKPDQRRQGLAPHPLSVLEETGRGP